MAEPATSALEGVCTVLGLGPAWAPVLGRLNENLSEPLAWRRRFLTDTEPVTARDLRVVALRMQGLGPTRIASRTGRRSVQPRAHIDRICLAVAVRLAEPGSQGGAVGARRRGAAIDRLVYEGIPAYTDDPVSQDAFDRLWLQGLPLDEIRAALAISPKVAKAHAAAAAPRWVGKDVAAFLGWSRENHRLRMARGHFPRPDGRSPSSSGAGKDSGGGTGKDWWWPSTVKDWAASQPFVRCPQCNALVARLKQHLTKHQKVGG